MRRYQTAGPVGSRRSWSCFPHTGHPAFASRAGEAAVFFGLLPCSGIRVWLKGRADSLPFHPGDRHFSGREAKDSAFGDEDHVVSSAGFVEPLGCFFF